MKLSVVTITCLALVLTTPVAVAQTDSMERTPLRRQEPVHRGSLRLRGTDANDQPHLPSTSSSIDRPEDAAATPPAGRQLQNPARTMRMMTRTTDPAPTDEATHSQAYSQAHPQAHPHPPTHSSTKPPNACPIAQPHKRTDPPTQPQSHQRADPAADRDAHIHSFLHANPKAHGKTITASHCSANSTAQPAPDAPANNPTGT